MNRFEFEPDLTILDDRSKFANVVCQLLYDRHDGDIDKAVHEAEESLFIFQFFEEYVRNIYELIDSEIPMFAYYELKKYKKEDFDLSETEYEEAISRTIEACKYYYGKISSIESVESEFCNCNLANRFLYEYKDNACRNCGKKLKPE